MRLLLQNGEEVMPIVTMHEPYVVSLDGQKIVRSSWERIAFVVESKVLRPTLY